jgi:hypothetical protein
METERRQQATLVPNLRRKGAERELKKSLLVCFFIGITSPDGEMD